MLIRALRDSSFKFHFGGVSVNDQTMLRGRVRLLAEECFGAFKGVLRTIGEIRETKSPMRKSTTEVAENGRVERTAKANAALRAGAVAQRFFLGRQRGVIC